MKRELQTLKNIIKTGIKLSRNKNFDFFSIPENKKALDYYMYLQGIIKDLLDERSIVTIQREEYDRYKFLIEKKSFGYKREINLEKEEIDFLFELNEKIKERLHTILNECLK